MPQCEPARVAFLRRQRAADAVRAMSTQLALRAIVVIAPPSVTADLTHAVCDLLTTAGAHGDSATLSQSRWWHDAITASSVVARHLLQQTQTIHSFRVAEGVAKQAITACLDGLHAYADQLDKRDAGVWSKAASSLPLRLALVTFYHLLLSCFDELQSCKWPVNEKKRPQTHCGVHCQMLVDERICWTLRVTSDCHHSCDTSAIWQLQGNWKQRLNRCVIFTCSWRCRMMMIGLVRRLQSLVVRLLCVVCVCVACVAVCVVVCVLFAHTSRSTRTAVKKALAAAKRHCRGRGVLLQHACFVTRRRRARQYRTRRFVSFAGKVVQSCTLLCQTGGGARASHVPSKRPGS